MDAGWRVSYARPAKALVFGLSLLNKTDSLTHTTIMFSEGTTEFDQVSAFFEVNRAPR